MSGIFCFQGEITMKKFLSIFTAASMLLAMTACSSPADSSASDSSSAADSSASAAQTAESSQPVQQESSEADESSAASTVEADDARTDYEKMVDRSLLSVGDMTRMADVFQKAQNGEDITVAYIGGSITEGYNAGTTEFYAKTCTDLLQGYFPDITVTGVNAGISGTPSLLGNLRLERDVLSADPDIVFVEFAVNDGQEADYKNAYESLVRTLLTQEKDIAVVLLFTVLDSGYTCQEHMSKIGANYDLPMISVHDSVYEEIEAGKMTWQDYSNDQSHPNAYGHKCITDFVDNYYQKVLPVVAENVGEVSKELPDPVFSAKYMNMHYMDSATMDGVELDGFEQYDTHGSFHNGWMYRGTDGGSMKFTVDCSVLEMVFKANNSDKYGTADIYVDGEKVKSVVSNMSDGWNNPVTAYLIDNDSSAEHTVEIRMEGGVTQAFFVMAFGYCD
ncbi:MAG TPA: SGNH/GDSL hydrolase family protein [Ruminococcaceae bacterium]|nr:SGNH/GDSL hydrolase family protein [Oscillospiraceae bacterium]